MTQRPERSEAHEYFFTYIDQAPGDDVRVVLHEQAASVLATLGAIDEERSRHRYAEGKWSIREIVSHVNDCERMFIFRAFWFARGFESGLPSFDQERAMRHASADERTMADHVAEFAAVRASTLALADSLSAEAWTRVGTASEMRFSARALAWIAAGHVEHHMRLLRERY
ncbi:MAG: DinB family protein [Gemmatimonadaceae bacterium]